MTTAKMLRRLTSVVFSAGAMLGNGAFAEILFGDTYAYHNTSWGDYIEMDLKKANSMKVYVDGATPDSGIAHTHIALFEVAGASSKDEISPVVENLGFNGTLRAAVWTDEELRGAVLPPPSTADEWESDGRSIDSRTPNDISGSCNFSHDPDYVYVYESDDGEFNWPQALWPDNKAVDDRFWVSVECQPSEVGRWGGVDGGFRVWQSGTEVKSEKMYVTYETEGAWPCATNLPALFRGLPLANSDRYGFDISLWDVIHVAYGVPLHAYWLDATSEKPGAPLSITLPEAGILYMSAYDGDLDGISVENADAVERERVSWDEYEEMGSERYFYQYCADFMNRSVLAVKVNSAKTIRLVQEDDFEDYDIDRIQFFPNETKAVAVEASFVSIFDRNRYPRCSDNIGEYLQGYVTGTGVYKVGETVALTAVPAPGEAFDHWELKYGNFPSGIDTTKPVLNFVVTDACAGTAEERKQMVVRAVWKAKRQIIATTDNISGGIASGSGFYHDGASVTLTAQPAAGFEFAGWSDGVKTATRTVSVSGDAEYVARFAGKKCHVTFNANGGGGAMESQVAEIGSAITLNGCAFSKTGFTFVQWKGSDGKTYRDGQTITLSDDLVLTAQWKWIQPSPVGAELTVNDSGVLVGVNLGDATEIAIPEGVTAIGAGAFAGQGGLVRVTIPSSVKRIGAGAFMNCAALTEVLIPEGVERIGERAFYGCKAISSVAIPGSVVSVDDYAFARCYSLRSVAIAEGVERIGWFAFAWCSSLTDVEKPETDEIDIGVEAFYGCP